METKNEELKVKDMRAQVLDALLGDDTHNMGAEKVASDKADLIKSLEGEETKDSLIHALDSLVMDAESEEVETAIVTEEVSDEGENGPEGSRESDDGEFSENEGNKIVTVSATFTVDPAIYQSMNYRPSPQQRLEIRQKQSQGQMKDLIKEQGKEGKGSEKKSEDEAVVVDYATYIDGSSFLCDDLQNGIDYSQIAMDITPRRAVTRENCETTFAQCRAQNPLFCRFHGPKLLETDLNLRIRQLLRNQFGRRGDAGLKVKVTKDRDSNDPMKFRITVECQERHRQDVENALTELFTNTPGITSNDVRGNNARGDITQEFEMDLLRVDRPPMPASREGAAANRRDAMVASNRTMAQVEETPPIRVRSPRRARVEAPPQRPTENVNEAPPAENTAQGEERLMGYPFTENDLMYASAEIARAAGEDVGIVRGMLFEAMRQLNEGQEINPVLRGTLAAYLPEDNPVYIGLKQKLEEVLAGNTRNNQANPPPSNPPSSNTTPPRTIGGLNISEEDIDEAARIASASTDDRVDVNTARSVITSIIANLERGDEVHQMEIERVREHLPEDNPVRMAIEQKDAENKLAREEREREALRNRREQQARTLGLTAEEISQAAAEVIGETEGGAYEDTLSGLYDTFSALQRGELPSNMTVLDSSLTILPQDNKVRQKLDELYQNYKQNVVLPTLDEVEDVDLEEAQAAVPPVQYTGTAEEVLAKRRENEEYWRVNNPTPEQIIKEIAKTNRRNRKVMQADKALAKKIMPEVRPLKEKSMAKIVGFSRKSDGGCNCWKSTSSLLLRLRGFQVVAREQNEASPVFADTKASGGGQQITFMVSQRKFADGFQRVDTRDIVKSLRKIAQGSGTELPYPDGTIVLRWSGGHSTAAMLWKGKWIVCDPWNQSGREGLGGAIIKDDVDVADGICRVDDGEIAREATFTARDVTRKMVEQPGWEREFSSDRRKAMYLDYLAKERELLAPNTIHTAESQKVNRLKEALLWVRQKKRELGEESYIGPLNYEGDDQEMRDAIRDVQKLSGYVGSRNLNQYLTAVENVATKKAENRELTLSKERELGREVGKAKIRLARQGVNNPTPREIAENCLDDLFLKYAITPIVEDLLIEDETIKDIKGSYIIRPDQQLIPAMFGLVKPSNK